MNDQIFRKESVEGISSPERLQDYMKVTNPGVWMVLVSVIVLLTGLIICSAIGSLETVIPVEAAAEDGTITMILESEDADAVKTGMTLRLADRETRIEYVYQKTSGETVATADATEISLPDGRYDAEIVTESIRPISFLIN